MTSLAVCLECAALRPKLENIHQLLESRGLSLKLVTGNQGSLEMFHAFLVEGFDLGDVNV